MNSIEFVSAGAGSGKTYRLTEALAQALESGQVRPHAIVATTFTVKAATELRERARSWLLERKRIDLATAIGQSRIGTVNSVCGELLKRFCFELGLSPDQTVLSEGQTKRLLATSLAETLDEAGQSELVALTERFGIEQSEWAKAISDIVKAARDNDIAPADLKAMGGANADLMLANWPAPTTGPDPTALLVAEQAKALTSVAKYVQETQAAGGKPAANLLKGLKDLERLDRAFRDGRWTWPDWIAAQTLDAGAKVKDQLEPLKAAAQAHESHPLFHAEVRRYLELVFGLAADALDTYAQSKRTLGAVDFGDQEVLLLRAIRENQEVRDALAGELDLVMVDEFQDTSPLQLALFVELAELAKRSVWVGDPKQAIYGFRGTDAGLIAGVLNAIPGWGGKLGAPLTTSRRSTPALVSLTNGVFENAFLPNLTPAQVRLTPTHANIGDQPALFNWNFESSKNEADYLGLGLAVRKLVASGIQVGDKASKDLRAVRPGDVAVLCRTNSQVEYAVTSLTRWGVPSASPRAGLLATAEAILILACLRRLLDPTDTVASALIVTLADGTHTADWLAHRLDFLKSGAAASHHWKAVGADTHPLLARLESLRPQLKTLTPYEAIRLAKAESHVARLSSQWSRSPHEARTRIANVEALLDLAQTYEGECVSAKRPATVSGLLRWLEALAKAGDDDRASSAEDAVTVMTHHGAKGLEWPVVVLTSLGSESRSALWGVRAKTNGVFDPLQPLSNRFVHFWLKTWGRRTQPQAAVNAEASVTGTTMTADAIAENTRLLYVSMTRARDINVLVSCSRKQVFNHGWTDEIAGATQLLFGNSGTLKLPDGTQLIRETQSFSAEDCNAQPPEQAIVDRGWFVPRDAASNSALWFRPSSATGGGFSVDKSETVGTRLAIAGKPDMTSLGSALHLCIARSNTVNRVDESDVERILKSWGVATVVDKAATRAQLESFRAWVATRWPGSRVLTEVPVEADRADGTRLRGRIDLLVETAAGWILFDHKSNPGSSARDEELAAEHGPQLAAYAEALLRATGQPVLEQWLYLPVAARAVRLTVEA